MKSIALLLLLLLLQTFTFAAGAEVSVRKTVKNDPRQEYFLIDHSGGEAPRGGYKLLLVLPGGNGSADFNPFVTNIAKHAAGREYLVAQLIAVKWTPDQQVIWPTARSKVEKMKFTTEEFISAVIADLGKDRKIDADHIYTLTWSSSGPAAYAASLTVEEIKGSFVAMSVFKPGSLPSLSKAKGHRYYIYHSPDDKVCPMRMAEEARDQLDNKGAKVKFVTYKGGHGWHGNIFGDLRKGFQWLADR